MGDNKGMKGSIMKEEKITKRVAIVGFGETKKQTPFEDKDLEIWGMNDLYEDLPRYDRWFDIHDFDSDDPNSIKTHVSPRAKEQKLAAYKKMKCPIYCQEAFPEIPNAVKYPLKEIQDKWCGGGKGYFTNQVSYMIALAIHEGYDEIGVYGIDMMIDTEYSIQRPSCEYWLGIAAGMGKRVIVPTRSTLLKTKYIYAYDHKEHNDFVEMYEAKVHYWEEEKAKASKIIEEQTTLFSQYVGAINSTATMLKEWDNV